MQQIIIMKEEVAEKQQIIIMKELWLKTNKQITTTTTQKITMKEELCQ